MKEKSITVQPSLQVANQIEITLQLCACVPVLYGHIRLVLRDISSN